MLDKFKHWLARKAETGEKQLTPEQLQLKKRMQELLRNEHILRDEMKLTVVFDYSKKDVGLEILQHYGATVFMAGVSGKAPLNVSRTELNEFCTQMAVAAIFDDPTGVAFSCFCQQTNSFAVFLPVPPSYMSPEARDILFSLVEDKSLAELSPSGRQYLDKYQDELQAYF